MEATKDELAARFEKLSNSELLKRVESGTLTALAQEVACEELQARGVQFEQSRQDKDPENTEAEPPSGASFVTIAHIVNPLRANLLRSFLQSEGIVVHLLGEHLGVTHMFLSAGTGGIRVQVRSDHVDRAREMLAEFDRIEANVENISDDEVLGSESKNPEHHRAAAENPERRSNPARARQKTAVFLWFFTIALAVLVIVVLGASN